MRQENMTELSEKDSVNIINPMNAIINPHYNFQLLSKAQAVSQTQELFTDYQFRLSSSKETENIKIRRLSEIYPSKISLFLDMKTGYQLSQPTVKKNNIWTPTYLSEINMLPFSHWFKLIEPQYINQKGFYYVVVCRNGLMTKEIIDDKFYYDEKENKIVTHSGLSDHIWVHIIVKMWAKLNKGYENLKNCRSFSFIRNFSFPDWDVMNPNKEKKQVIISKLTKATNRNEYLIGKTKDDPKVGYFGFGADCASYVIAGHYQQYGDIYIKIVSYTLGGWNSLTSRQSSHPPEQKQPLAENEFMVPIEQFLNVFHLIYSTSNKYSNPMSQNIHSINYHKYNINIDALSTNAVMIGLEVTPDNARQSIQNIQVALSFYFPHIKIFDLGKNQHSTNQLGKLVVPWSKILVGRQEDCSHLDCYQMEVMKEGLITYNSQGLMSYSIHKNNHEYILGDYFKGYANQVTYSLSLRPGKYYIRLKTQPKISEYHCYATSVSINGSSKFYEPCLKQEEEASFLQDCLFRKAVMDKKGVTFINPAKRGSWISCRDQQETIGYSYIAVHVVKNADNKIILKVDPIVLKEHGYIIKQEKDLKNFQITIDSQQNTLIIFKHDKEWKGTGKRIWPPPGIQFRKIPRKTNTNLLSEKDRSIHSEKY